MWKVVNEWVGGGLLLLCQLFCGRALAWEGKPAWYFDLSENRVQESRMILTESIQEFSVSGTGKECPAPKLKWENHELDSSKELFFRSDFLPIESGLLTILVVGPVSCRYEITGILSSESPEANSDKRGKVKNPPPTDSKATIEQGLKEKVDERVVNVGNGTSNFYVQPGASVKVKVDQTNNVGGKNSTVINIYRMDSVHSEMTVNQANNHSEADSIGGANTQARELKVVVVNPEEILSDDGHGQIVLKGRYPVGTLFTVTGKIYRANSPTGDEAKTLAKNTDKRDGLKKHHSTPSELAPPGLGSDGLLHYYSYLPPIAMPYTGDFYTDNNLINANNLRNQEIANINEQILQYARQTGHQFGVGQLMPTEAMRTLVVPPIRPTILIPLVAYPQ